MLDARGPLLALADTIPWDYFNKELERYYSDKGRPANPIRLMVGLLMLKQLKDLSDEELTLQVKHNPYYQYFCGFETFQTTTPCHPTDLVYFRQRIGNYLCIRNWSNWSASRCRSRNSSVSGLTKSRSVLTVTWSSCSRRNKCSRAARWRCASRA